MELEVAAHFSSDGHQLSNAMFVGLEKVCKGWKFTGERVSRGGWAC